MPRLRRFGGGAAVLALALLCGWHLALRRHGLQLPMSSDEGEYAYEARVLESGGLPYRDAFDQKPPMVFFLYELAERTLGRAPDGPRRLAILFSLASILLVFFSVPKEWGGAARLAAAAAFATLSTLPVGDLGFAANTEVFLTGFSAAAFWALLRSWTGGAPRWYVLVAGIFAGAALSTKQTFAWTALALAVLAALPSRGNSQRDSGIRWDGAAFFIAGCAAIPTLFFIYFASRGGWADLVEQALVRNLAYGSIILKSGAAGGQLSWFARGLLPQLLRGAWPCCALAAWGLFRTRAGLDSPVEIAIVAWLGASIIGAATGLFFFPHYFLAIFPPLALAAALGIHQLPGAKRWIGAGLVFLLAVYPAAAYARIYFSDPPERVAEKLLFPNPLFESEVLAEYIRDHSSPDDTMYVFGSEPQLYVEAGRRCATRHIFVYPLTLFPDSPRRSEKELSDLNAAKPKFVVFTTLPASTLVASKWGEAFRGGLIGWLTRNYGWIGTIEVRRDGSRVVLWGEGQGSGQEMPDWSAPDRLYLFERS